MPKQQIKWLGWLGAMFLLLVVTGCGGSDKKEGTIELQATQDGYQAKLEIKPGIAGVNTYTVTITNDKAQTTAGQGAVLHFEMPNMNTHGKSEKELKKQKEANWQESGPHIMMPGEWQSMLEWKDDQGQVHTFLYNYQIKE
ncbi:hypothetical protein B9C88_20675 [Brevibacillus laterosporus]|uniref:hypothetical protein n=1 Tax=Brevibacillus laterosporus TaxID=1465 RepID=UPI000BD681ED|nr:hypothetical protein [Brevibacillus laterosporus]PCN42432.1 hypothetical protein B9C88_20675 [Brevibacillus laterosporus]